jgi:hypothetical protein
VVSLSMVRMRLPLLGMVDSVHFVASLIVTKIT